MGCWTRNRDPCDGDIRDVTSASFPALLNYWPAGTGDPPAAII